MLTGYTVKGFKSFASETAVEMKAKNYKILSDTNVADGVLKGCMFIGANASGKSNIVLALKLLLDLLFANTDVSLKNYLCKFSIGDELMLRYCFQIEGKEIEYAVEYDNAKSVTIEKLIVEGEQLLDRIGSGAADTISGKKNTYDNIPDGSLILREIYFNSKFRSNGTLKAWFDFLMNSVYIDLYKQKIFSYKDTDLGTIEFLSRGGAEKINAFFKKYSFGQTIEYDEGAEKSSRISFKRDGINARIPFGLESLGNQNLLSLLPKFFYVIENGGLLILDEFSSGFHNDLEELLIRYFMKNAEKAQLIFVSHSTNLLSNRLLRPDQIYTIDFETDRGSVINRVSNQQPREGQNLEKMYLGGVFDGLPKYNDIAE